MTYHGSRGFGAALILFVAFTLMLLVWQSSGDDVCAQTTYIVGDWVIENKTITLTDQTVDVRGDVTIGEGGRLVMVNSTLVMNTTVESGQDMLVDRGGSMKCVDSEIEGGYDLSFLRILNDTVLIRTTVKYFNGWQQDQGVKLEDGMVQLCDSEVWARTKAWTDVLIVDTIMMYGLTLVYRHPDVDASLAWVIRDLESDPRGFPIRVEISDGPVLPVDLMIENMPFTVYNGGITALISQGLNMTVRDCRFVNAGTAIGIAEGDGGRCAIINNTIIFDREETTQIGFRLYMSGRSNLTLANNTVDGANTAYRILTSIGPHLSVSFENLSAMNSMFHVLVFSDYEDGLPDFHVTIHNSSFQGWGGFYVGNGASLTLFNTEHVPGSCFLGDGAHLARAYTYLDIGSVGWLNGPNITSGRLLLMDDEDNVVRNYLVDSLEPEMMVGWEMTPLNEFVYEDLKPTISRGGRKFSGVPMDIWGPMPVAALIIDDVVPVVNITTPAMGHHHDDGAITITGTYFEEGTGIGSITYSLGTSDPVELTGYASGSWAISITDLPDGEHTFTITAVDIVGNVAEPTMVIFTIDTIIPPLDVDDPPTDTNSSELVVTGRTEPNAKVLLNGVEHNIRADGSFEFFLYMREGPNHFSIVARDRAGNHNMTEFMVRLDSTPPYLLVESPWNDSWITSMEVLVVGETEPDARLEIDHREVVTTRGTFEHLVELRFGEFHLHIVVQDKAGNTQHRYIVLFVDWLAPRVSLESPERTTTYTNDDTAFILGKADDMYLDTVHIDGEVVEAPDGTFLKQYDLEVGKNLFEITVKDLAGNEWTDSVTIIRDVDPPITTCEISAIDGDLTHVGHLIYSTTPSFRLTVEGSEPILIVVGDETYGPSREHSLDLEMPEGTSGIEVVISDRAGNEVVPYKYDLVVDTIPPDLVVSVSIVGSKTEEDSITIYGYTEAGAGLTVDGVRRSVGFDGAFDEEAPLEVGVNEIVVTVTDVAGNTNSVTVTIKRVEPDPDYSVGMVGLGLLLVSAAVILALVTMRYLKKQGKDPVT